MKDTHEEYKIGDVFYRVNSIGQVVIMKIRSISGHRLYNIEYFLDDKKFKGTYSFKLITQVFDKCGKLGQVLYG